MKTLIIVLTLSATLFSGAAELNLAQEETKIKNKQEHTPTKVVNWRHKCTDECNAKTDSSILLKEDNYPIFSKYIPPKKILEENKVKVNCSHRDIRNSDGELVHYVNDGHTHFVGETD